MPYNLTNVIKVAIIETTRREQQMYGLPDSMIVGTAKRINSYLDSKTRAQGKWPRMMDRLYLSYLERKETKRTKEALAKKHGVSFSD